MSLRGRHNSANMPVERVSFLVVRLGGSYFALPAAGVRGLLTQAEAGYEQAVTAVGTVYQPVDLVQRLSVAADLSSPDMRMVLYSTGLIQGAIRVEQVVGLVEVARQDCLPLPLQFQGDERSWFEGMTLYMDLLVLILNPLWALGESPGIATASVWQAEQPIVATPATVCGSC
ncbi:MAG: chemotaxis protein CheW [Nitrospiraceae bacterium]